MGESSLDFDVVYHVTKAEYAVFMDTQQSIFLKLFGQFAAAGIEFAYPTSVVKLAGGEPREPDLDQVRAPRPRAPYEVVRPR